MNKFIFVAILGFFLNSYSDEMYDQFEIYELNYDVIKNDNPKEINKEEIKSVFLLDKKTGIVKKLQAVYDSKSDSWIECWIEITDSPKKFDFRKLK